MRKIIVLLIVLLSMQLSAQKKDSVYDPYLNIASKLLSNDSKLTIGGYGEVHYNQPFNKGKRSNGTLDVHRIVIFYGYNFNEKTKFISEIEFEYAKELWVEQAFLQHEINDYINFRAGLLLVPMGIINEYHEPVTFNGVERPVIDNKISPSTWREIGMGFAGNILPATLKYQVYLINGFNSYDGTAKLNGDKGLREGRQKGSKAFISSPNITGKIEYYGIKGLNAGVSGYYGNTQSKLYNGLDRNDKTGLQRADSSVVGVSMLGADARYQIKGIELRGQFYYTSIANTYQYNIFTGNGTINNNLGSSLIGYYAEAAYNVFRPFKQIKYELLPFVRYQTYDTHNTVNASTEKNKSYQADIITTGLTLKLVQGAVLKTDIDFIKTKADSKYAKVFNAGFGVMF